MMAIAMALQSALRTTLEELAALHGFKEGRWLDDLEKTLIEDASNIWSQGLPLEAERQAIDNGRRLMMTVVDALRQQLALYRDSTGRT